MATLWSMRGDRNRDWRLGAGHGDGSAISESEAGSKAAKNLSRRLSSESVP